MNIVLLLICNRFFLIPPPFDVNVLVSYVVFLVSIEEIKVLISLKQISVCCLQHSSIGIQIFSYLKLI